MTIEQDLNFSTKVPKSFQRKWFHICANGSYEYATVKKKRFVPKRTILDKRKRREPLLRIITTFAMERETLRDGRRAVRFSEDACVVGDDDDDEGRERYRLLAHERQRGQQFANCSRESNRRGAFFLFFSFSSSALSFVRARSRKETNSILVSLSGRCVQGYISPSLSRERCGTRHVKKRAGYVIDRMRC